MCEVALGPPPWHQRLFTGCFQQYFIGDLKNTYGPPLTPAVTRKVATEPMGILKLSDLQQHSHEFLSPSGLQVTQGKKVTKAPKVTACQVTPETKGQMVNQVFLCNFFSIASFCYNVDEYSDDSWGLKKATIACPVSNTCLFSQAPWTGVSKTCQKQQLWWTTVPNNWSVSTNVHVLHLCLYLPQSSSASFPPTTICVHLWRRSLGACVRAPLTGLACTLHWSCWQIG